MEQSEKIGEYSIAGNLILVLIKRGLSYLSGSAAFTADAIHFRRRTLAGSLRDATNLDGAWSVYVSGRYAYVAANDATRLTVIDIAGMDAPSAYIGDLAVGTVDVWENAQVANNLYVDGGANVDPGGNELSPQQAVGYHVGYTSLRR